MNNSYLHDDKGDSTHVDGGLESCHGLGMSQSIQTGVIHFEQQVPFLWKLNQSYTLCWSDDDSVNFVNVA